MAPELRLVKGEMDDETQPFQFVPDRLIPVRVAQISALFAIASALAALFVNLKGFPPILFWLLCGFHGCICLWASSRAIQRSGVRYTLTSQRLEIERGIVARRRESLDLFRIRDVVLEQSMVQRMRGVGTITLYSTDQVEPTLALQSLGRVQSIYETLRDAASRARQQRVVQVDR